MSHILPTIGINIKITQIQIYIFLNNNNVNNYNNNNITSTPPQNNSTVWIYICNHYKYSNAKTCPSVHSLPDTNVLCTECGTLCRTRIYSAFPWDTVTLTLFCSHPHYQESSSSEKLVEKKCCSSRLAVPLRTTRLPQGFGHHPETKEQRSVVVSTKIEKSSSLSNDALNTFCLWLYGVGHIVKDHSDNQRGNLVPPLHGVFFLISNKVSFICIISHIG